jgi:anti-sigma factor RsiW
MKTARRLLLRQCVQNELSCYLDGELSDRRAARVAAHVRDCEDCARELNTLQATVEMLRATPVPGMPRSVVIPASAIAAQRQTRRVDHTFVALRASAAAVTVILAVLLSRDAFGTLGTSAREVAYSNTAMDSATGEAASGPVALPQAAPQVAAESGAEAVVAGAEPIEPVTARQSQPAAGGAGEAKPAAPPLAPTAELEEDSETLVESAPEVAPLIAEAPAEAQSLSTEVEAAPAAKSAGDAQLRDAPQFWTPLRIISAALGGMLAALVGVLFTVSRHRLTL